MIFRKILLVSIFIIAGIVVWRLWLHTQGTITFIAADGSTQSEQIKDCAAGVGSRPTLFGVHMRTSGDTDLFVNDSKLVPIEPTHLQLSRHAETPIDIDPQNCSKLSVSLTWGGGNIYTDVLNHVNGNIEAQCQLTDGSQLRLEASLHGCGLK